MFQPSKFWATYCKPVFQISIITVFAIRLSSSNASAVAKTVICPGFILSTGAAVYVKFNNTNTADIGSITLNINNTGAKPIRYHGELLPDAGYLKAGTTYCFIYDS